jgi:hypothetical protein
MAILLHCLHIHTNVLTIDICENMYLCLTLTDKGDIDILKIPLAACIVCTRVEFFGAPCMPLVFKYWPSLPFYCISLPFSICIFVDAHVSVIIAYVTI